MKQQRPYGAWTSRVSPKMITAGGIRFGGLTAEGEDCYWVEGRAAEGGRNVIVRSGAQGEPVDLTPEGFNVRTRVHEYGGGAFAVHRRTVWFVNFADQGLYVQSEGGSPVCLHPGGKVRFADLLVDAPRARLICVVEDHRGEGEARNFLGAVAWDGGALTELAGGHDFFSSPALHPDGDALAWLTWDHPCMPWDETQLWVGRLDAAGVPGDPRKVAGGNRVSVFQPQWSPDGELFYVADPLGWWNLYAWSGGSSRAVHEGPRELGRPQWVFGLRTYGWLGGRPGRIFSLYCEQGRWHMGWIDPENGHLEPIPSAMHHVDALALGESVVYVVGGAPRRANEVARFDPHRGGLHTLRRGTSVTLASELVSEPESITFPTSAGDEAHGYYYAPYNPAFEAPAGERPPLMVIGHGGPTGSTSPTLSPSIQYWTSRGFAVLDVNYRGSTGYGRAYRDRLNGEWGVFDVEDCVNGARTLVERGLADPRRLAIRGGSAGGYTALAALTFHDTFTAGASYYGIGELEALARDTHKFESRYLDQLIGPYPQEKALYASRSPINFTEQLSCPVIFFQGLEDKVVPPNQAEMMVAALRKKGLPVAYLTFEHEQHGFRAASTIERTLEAELYFYGRIFGFEPAGEIGPVEIEGLC